MKVQIKDNIFALIDKEDYIRIKDYKWKLLPNGYAQSNKYLYRKNGKDVKEIKLMHRIIMNAKKGQYVDHINHNKLDNRKINLRLVTPQQNNFNRLRSKVNTSGFTGVAWDKSRNKWMTQIKINNKSKTIGRFQNKTEAYLARLEAERKYFVYV